jgi:hypothetical protein
MTSTRSFSIFVATCLAGLICSLVFVGTHAKDKDLPKATPLGIEISLQKVFYVAAGNTTKIVIRASSDLADHGNISAIRLEPKMEGTKVRVAVSLLVGEPDDVRTCRDWDALRALPVGSYLAGLDDEVTLTKLREYGVQTGSDPLTFRVVPKKFPLGVQEAVIGGDCECATCGGATCCAYPGYCLGCNPCGYVCCSGS